MGPEVQGTLIYKIVKMDLNANLCLDGHVKEPQYMHVYVLEARP